MKYLIAIPFLIATSLSFGQGYTDTVAYKTGKVRAVEILKRSETSIRFEYRNLSGNSVTGSVRISMLDWYTMDGERNDLLSDVNGVNSGYTDTVAYKTGLVRIVKIIRLTDTSIKYEYKATSGKSMITSVRFSMLNWYTMNGERDDLLPDFNASNMGYEDKLYFRTGEIRMARIDKETRLAYQYEFVNVNGKITTVTTRKSLLNKVIVGNKDSTIAEDFISPSPTSIRYKE